MYKSKGNHSYSHLHQALFDKLNAIQSGNLVSQSSYQDQRFKSFKYEKISQLIDRAKGITATNQTKLGKAKATFRKPKSQNTAFLTGVYIMERQKTVPAPQPQEPEPVFQEPNSDQYLQELNQIRTDDLSELRKMIRDTDNKLNRYGKNLSRTKLSVLNAAEKVGQTVGRSLNMKIQQCAQFLPKLERRSSIKRMASTRK